jgi:chromosome segregation ATPase
MDKITSECPHLVDLRTENKELLTAVDNWKHAYFSIWESTSLRRRCECTKLRERVKELESADPYCPVVLIKTNEELKQRVKELEQDAVSYRSNLREAFRMGQDQTKEIQRLRQRKEEEEGRNIALRQRVKERDSELMKAYSERTKLAERVKELESERNLLEARVDNWKHAYFDLEEVRKCARARVNELDRYVATIYLRNYIERLTKKAKIDLTSAHR